MQLSSVLLPLPDTPSTAVTFCVMAASMSRWNFPSRLQKPSFNMGLGGIEGAGVQSEYFIGDCG